MGGYKVIHGKIVIGLVEEIKLNHSTGDKQLFAKIDTGATKSSIDRELASELGLGPIITSKVVKSAHGTTIRPVIEAELQLAGQKIKSEFTLADRFHMKYKILIGQNILKQGFMIDPGKE